MISVIYDLYQTTDLFGNELTFPLKAYNQFFAKKIQESKNLETVAWVIGNIASGIFAYPLFGLLASIGMGIKLGAFYDLYQHNKDQKENLTRAQYINGSHSKSAIGWELKKREVHEISGDIDLDKALSNIAKSIDDFTWKFRKIYLDTETQTTKIKVTIRTFDPI